MAKGASARAAARRQKDKWKAKRWFSIRAPRNPWSFKVIGETIAEEEQMLVGRHYEVMQNELDGDFSKMHVKIQFRVHEVVGNDALTEFIGHDTMKDFVRRQIRRERGKIDDSIDVITDDGYFIRLKPFIVTRSRVKGSQKQETRTIARNEVIKFCSKSTWIEVQSSLLDGSLEERVGKAISKIQPVRMVFFRRSQLIQSGVVIDDGPTLEQIKADEKSAIEDQKSSEEESDVEIADSEISEDAIPEEVIESDDQPEELMEEEDNEKEVVAPGPDSPNLIGLGSRLKAELVEISKSLNIESSGTKAVLVERIYSSLSVAELKQLLKESGKPVSGKKADLIQRLSE